MKPTKVCTGCKRDLPRDAYHPRAKGSRYINARCKECCAESARAWRATHPEQHAANYERWAKADPERHAARLRQWRAAAPENAAKDSFWARRWAAAHPEKMRARAARRRALLLGASVGNVTAEGLRRLFADQRGRCHYCSVPLQRRHLEHRTPLARGGAHAIENLCWACPRCNLRKGKLTEPEFRARCAA